MNKFIPIVLQLQQDAIENNVSVATMLRRAKAIATKLSKTDAIEWIDLELNGYEGISMGKIPSYRHLEGIPKYFNPYHGWQQLTFTNTEDLKKLSIKTIPFSLSSIEEQCSDLKEGIMVPFLPEENKYLIQLFNNDFSYSLYINRISLWNVIDKVRILILNWSLDLEKEGVIGYDMTFTPRETEAAKTVTINHINMHGNIGVFGSVNDFATVTNHQTVQNEIDSDQVRDFIDQSRQALSLLPEDIAHRLKPLLDQINQSTQSPTTIQNVMFSIRSICEEVTSNIASAKIIELISKFFP